MATVTLSFSPEEENEAAIATRATEYYLALCEFAQYLRELRKYHDDRIESMTAPELLTEISEKFYTSYQDQLTDHAPF